MMTSTVTYKDTVQFIPPITCGIVVKVYDGDTITIASKLPYDESPLYRFSVRLNGIDCPEMHSKIQAEKEMAQQASNALYLKLMGRKVFLHNVQTEKYGRILADVTCLDKNGNHENISEWLIRNGYARVYNGGKKESFV